MEDETETKKDERKEGESGRIIRNKNRRKKGERQVEEEDGRTEGRRN